MTEHQTTAVARRDDAGQAMPAEPEGRARLLAELTEAHRSAARAWECVVRLLEALADRQRLSAQQSQPPAVTSEVAAEIRARLVEACAMVAALCDGSREWIIHIPARPDEDPDIVIGHALDDARWMLDQLETAAAPGEREGEECRTHAHSDRRGR